MDSDQRRGWRSWARACYTWLLVALNWMHRALIYYIEKNNEAFDPLLAWVQNTLPECAIPNDYGSSWKDGILGLALIERMHPGCCGATGLRPRDRWNAVLKALENLLGTPPIASVEQLCEGRPEKIIATLTQIRACGEFSADPHQPLQQELQVPRSSAASSYAGSIKKKRVLRKIVKIKRRDSDPTEGIFTSASHDTLSFSHVKKKLIDDLDSKDESNNENVKVENIEVDQNSEASEGKMENSGILPYENDVLSDGTPEAGKNECDPQYEKSVLNEVMQCTKDYEDKEKNEEKESSEIPIINIQTDIDTCEMSCSSLKENVRAEDLVDSSASLKYPDEADGQELRNVITPNEELYMQIVEIECGKRNGSPNAKLSLGDFCFTPVSTRIQKWEELAKVEDCPSPRRYSATPSPSPLDQSFCLKESYAGNSSYSDAEEEVAEVECPQIAKELVEKSNSSQSSEDLAVHQQQSEFFAATLRASPIFAADLPEIQIQDVSSPEQLLPYRQLVSGPEEADYQPTEEPPVPYPSRCRIYGTATRSGQVDMRNTFKVTTQGAGKGSLMVGVEGPGKHDVRETVVSHVSLDLYQVMYEVARPGIYTVSVLWSERHIPQSPFYVNVTY